MADALDLDDPNVLAYYGAPPAQPTPGAIDLDDPQIAAYYGIPSGPAHADAVDLDAPLPYQPNPGAPNYNPNPGAATQVAPQPPAAPAVLGAQPPGPPAPKPITPEGNAFRAGARLSSDVANAAPPQALGPTAADDVAFEHAKSKLAARPKAAGVGAAVAGNADPYGIKAANRALLGSFDQQKAAREHAGTAEQDKLLMHGEAMQDIARMRDEDAAIGRAEQDEFSKHFDDQMRQVEEQLAQVRAKKINVDDYVDQHGGSILAMIGGMAGGLYMGATKGSKNPFLEDLNANIDRWIGAQEKNIANERAAVSDKMNLLHQQRVAFKDDQLAKLQLRNMAYEAAKEAAAGEAEKSDSEIVKAHAEEGIAQINQAQAGVQKQIAERAQATAAAAAAQATARAKERQATFKEIYMKGISEGMSPAQAESEAMRVSAILYAPHLVGERPPEQPGDEFSGMTVRDRSHMKREEVIAQKEAEAELAALRDFKKRVPELSAGSAVGDYWSGAPGFLPGVSTAKANKLSRESYNATVARAYDAAMKAAQGAAPTESQKAQLKTFYLENNDSDEDVARKINAAEEFVIQAGRAKGLHESTPRETAKALGEKPIK